MASKSPITSLSDAPPVEEDDGEDELPSLVK
jgi:hypothetical protein